jgi:Ca2+-binding EF-hand superfamily protein
LINDIKSKLQARGTLGIRGLGRMFRILDNNGNRTLDIKELQYGLGDFGVYVDDEQAKIILNYFDRDRNGVVNYDEFLRAIRGDLNEFRLSLIKKAY